MDPRELREIKSSVRHFFKMMMLWRCWTVDGMVREGRSVQKYSGRHK